MRLPTVPRPSRSRFFAVMAWVALAVSVTGFSKTFFLPLAQGTFVPLPAAYVHGALMFSWVLLFALQATLIGARAHGLHRRLGWLGVLLAIAVAWSTVAIGMQGVQRDVAAGLGPSATSGIVGSCTAMLGFLLLVAAAVHQRRRPDVHRRLMLIATIALLWPAWLRFRHLFPAVPFPEWLFAVIAADSLLLVMAWHDWRTLGRVHPVTLWLGGALVADHVFETLAFDSAGWRVVADFLVRVLD